MYKCLFCNKEFKTENGFNKHNCEKKKRYDNLHPLGYSSFLLYYNFSKIPLPKNDNDKKMKFINSKLYKQFVSFGDWLNENFILDYVEYIKYLCYNMININEWKTEKCYRSFLYQYLKKEPEGNALYRSEQYLKNNNIELNTISQGRLQLALWTGQISIKYLKQQKFDYLTYLDGISADEKNKLKFFLEY